MGKQAPRLIGTNEKAIIHIAKKQLGMSEEAYRDMLQSVGVTSSRDLDLRKFEEVMRRLKHAGFQPVHKSAKRYGMHNMSSSEKGPMLSKVGAILAELKLEWSYADGIAMQMFGISALRFCNSTQTYKVLQAMILHQKRQREKAA